MEEIKLTDEQFNRVLSELCNRLINSKLGDSLKDLIEQKFNQEIRYSVMTILEYDKNRILDTGLSGCIKELFSRDDIKEELADIVLNKHRNETIYGATVLGLLQDIISGINNMNSRIDNVEGRLSDLEFKTE